MRELSEGLFQQSKFNINLLKDAGDARLKKKSCADQQEGGGHRGVLGKAGCQALYWIG